MNGHDDNLKNATSLLFKALDTKLPRGLKPMPEQPESDDSLIRNALHMWANYIETGNIALSAKDAQQANKPFKALDLPQMKLVVRLRELAEKHDL